MGQCAVKTCATATPTCISLVPCVCNADAAAALADFPQLTLINAPIRRRKAFANAVGLGLSVDELTPRDAKACEELAALVLIAFNDENDIQIAGKAMK